MLDGTNFTVCDIILVSSSGTAAVSGDVWFSSVWWLPLLHLCQKLQFNSSFMLLLPPLPLGWKARYLFRDIEFGTFISGTLHEKNVYRRSAWWFGSAVCLLSVLNDAWRWRSAAIFKISAAPCWETDTDKAAFWSRRQRSKHNFSSALWLWGTLLLISLFFFCISHVHLNAGWQQRQNI